MTVKQRTPLAKWEDVPGELPQGSVPKDVDLIAISYNAVEKLNSLKESHLASNVIWRDLLALTGTYRTLHSPATVFKTFTSLSWQKKRSVFRLKEGKEPRVEHGGLGSGSGWVDVDVEFTARHGDLEADCMGVVSVVPDAEGKWRIWMLRTWLESFDGHGHPDVLQPVADVRALNGTGDELHNGTNDKQSEEFDVVIVGGGQCGLSTAGRLKALGLSYVVLDNHPEAGDSWSLRYESLKWHTAKEYGNLPFGHTYPSEDEYCLPTKKIGAGFKAWTEKFGVDVRTSTAVDGASWDDTARRWTVTASVPDGRASFQCKQLVLSIGNGHGTPVSPDWATPEKIEASGFKGTIMHAYRGYKSAKPWAGKRGVVIGTANTGHDVAEDMANSGMETTIVQRNPTFVFASEWLWAAQNAHYTAETESAEADRETFTQPLKVQRAVVNQSIWFLIKAHPERFDALERAGFKLDRYADLFHNINVRYGGHYLDIGCSARIANGEIKVKAKTVQKLTQGGLLFEDGQELPADLIVLCTGFDHASRQDAARIVGPEIADQMDDFWGVDGEGELRALAKPAGYPNLWYMGGEIRVARFFSRFLALQIQAELLGQPLQPYLG